MKTMVTELQRMDNELYSMYQRSLEIAEMKWLPSVRPSKDSYNSYPHIKSIMGRIDRMLYEQEDNDFSLNGLELYILLCAILMHDIGKATESTDHGYESYKIILEQWPALGIPTEKSALIVADICRFHSCPDKMEMEKLFDIYYTDQFKRMEPVRGRMLGALLYLGDHMDNTFFRVVPRYLKSENSLEVVGNFRSRITDVKLDRKNKMIVEILDKTCFQKNELEGSKVLKGDLTDYLSKKRQDASGEIKEESILYTIAKDVLKNENEIIQIKDELNVMGMPVKKWLIECDEHLFRIYEKTDERGRTTLQSAYAMEPIIHLDYCLEVLRGICTLSGGIFARQFFKYSELVNFIREAETKTYKVKCAVRRLSLLLKAGEENDYTIYYDENNWNFYCQKQLDTENMKDQKEYVYEQIKEIIKKRLGEHHG